MFLSGLSKREFLEGAHQREMLGYPVSTVRDIATDPQLQARSFWQNVVTDDGRTERHNGAFFLRNGLRPPLRAAAPPPHAVAAQEAPCRPSKA